MKKNKWLLISVLFAKMSMSYTNFWMINDNLSSGPDVYINCTGVQLSEQLDANISENWVDGCYLQSADGIRIVNLGLDENPHGNGPEIITTSNVDPRFSINFMYDGNPDDPGYIDVNRL